MANRSAPVPPVPASPEEPTTETDEWERAEEMYEDDPLRFASEASDHGWSMMTGHCGGCGDVQCHTGPCPTDRNGFCTKCPERAR